MSKSIMIQGTMSNAGKSIVVAGLCRIFKQDGYSVCPFKSQNMALNSFITEDGFEMGRAQVMQAEAAGIKPSVLMNPILLKPTGDIGSQVIVNGKVKGNMNAVDYFRYKKELIPDIMNAYNELSANYDIIVIEGAGSPAEINLKSEDIVNMGMAKMADAPVLLVGDIDRGGVFASLYGTVLLLEDDERSRIKGLLINKFRGDVSLLNSGLKTLESLCKSPVLGVIPYGKFDIDDEDSLSNRLDITNKSGLLDIIVIKLPHLSNFTDFNPLENVEEISLRYVDNIRDFGHPDMVILPGTKNTIDDLIWLKESGLANIILKISSKNIPILGICGGYQMLGELLLDPNHIEGSLSSLDSLKGLSLLPLTTTFNSNKTRTRINGNVNNLNGFFAPLSNSPINGYEIHMGETTYSKNLLDTLPLATSSFSNIHLNTSNTNENTLNKLDGYCNDNVCGTYIHGIFDNEIFLTNLINLLLNERGLNNINDYSITNRFTYKEEQYDLLANTIRNNIDMNKIYEIIKGAN